VRGVKNGHAFASDGLGRVLAAVDDRSGANGRMVAEVPLRMTRTFYSIISTEPYEKVFADIARRTFDRS
jgi:hypothetical protein